MSLRYSRFSVFAAILLAAGCRHPAWAASLPTLSVDLRTWHKIILSDSAGPGNDRIVPLAVELVGTKSDCGDLLVGYLETRRILAGVQL
jgi:hypothetical protein